MEADRPWVVLFPYLPLTNEIRLGRRWELYPLADFPGPWALDWHEDVVRQIAAKHVTADRSKIRNPAILVDSALGFTGEIPNDDELAAIEAALGFGVIDAGRFWRSPAELELLARFEAERGRQTEPEVLEDLLERNEDRQYSGWAAGTSDNAEPYIWPVNADASIAMQYGLIIRTTAGGSIKVTAPAELNLPLHLSLDEERVSALYEILAQAPTDLAARQLREALRWLLQAWRNTPSLRIEHRVVLLRTAFEVLLVHGEQVGKETLARRLSDRFAELIGQEYVEPGKMLWLPGIERSLSEVDGAGPRATQKLAPFDDLERWFIGFSQARNAIVHDGESPVLSDPTESSVFAGEYWWVATRVLRDLALAELHGRGHHGLWRSPLSRQIHRDWPLWEAARRSLADEEAEDD